MAPGHAPCLSVLFTHTLPSLPLFQGPDLSLSEYASEAARRLPPLLLRRWSALLSEVVDSGKVSGLFHALERLERLLLGSSGVAPEEPEVAVQVQRNSVMGERRVGLQGLQPSTTVE